MALMTISPPGRNKVEDAGPVSKRIAELSELQDSLNGLDQFLEEKKKEMQEVSSVVEDLNSQKRETEKILDLSREQIEAIQNTMTHQRSKEKWLNITLSFMAGVLSSLVAQFCWSLFSSRREETSGTQRTE